jgi:uncharacterized protein
MSAWNVLSARRWTAVLVASALVFAACGGGDDDDSSGVRTSTTKREASSASGKVQVYPLFYRDLGNGDAEGGTNPVTVRLANGDDPKELRVGFTEDEVAGTGDQWRAAGWNAVTTATLLTGGPLGGKEITFDLNGQIDGPSAGGLMTVAVLSLLRGEKLKNDITMTGTINPDGTIGPVGGIPYKVDGVVEAKKTRMLIPTGQRNSEDNSGQLVDIVDEGDRKDIDVSEVADVYDAYNEFTGKQLPHPDEANVEVTEEAYQRIKAEVNDWLAKFESSANDFNSLDPTIQGYLGDTAQQAQSEAERAQSLSKQGLQAGAFQHAVFGAALANAVVKAGRATQIYLTQGADAFLQAIESSRAIKGRVQSLFDTLKTFDPNTVSDAAALIDSYSNAIDALSLTDYADSILGGLDSAASEEDALTIAITGGLFHELAGTIVDSAEDVFSVGRDLGGAKLDSKIDLQSVADFFRKASEANLAAFDTVVLGEVAKSNNASLDAVKVNFAGKDLDYALASSSLNVLQGGLDEYFGTNDDAAAFAKLGGAVSLYARASGLIAKYYSLGAELDDDLNVTGISNQKALQASLDLAQRQVQRSVAVLKAKKVDPTLVVAGYESAGVDREGDASDKLDALTSYWTGFVESRVLAYLGGFPTEGYR